MVLFRVVLNIHEVLDIDNPCGPPLWSHYFLLFSNEVLPVLNATVNFFIYFFAAKKFRTALMDMVLCRKKTRRRVVSKTSFRWRVFLFLMNFIYPSHNLELEK